MKNFSDNEIRRANQRLARLYNQGLTQSQGYKNIEQYYLKGTEGMTINKKGQIQFKRTKEQSAETKRLINQVLTYNTKYNVAPVKKTMGKVRQLKTSLQNIPQLQVVAPEYIEARIWQALQNTGKDFHYTEVMNLLSEEHTTEEWEQITSSLEKKVIDDIPNFKYADDFTQWALGKKELKSFSYDELNG